jgi:hypothetical protein
MGIEERNSYIDKTATDLKELSSKVESLKVKLSGGAKQMGDEYRSHLAEWQKKEAKVKEDLATLRNSSSEAFEGLKSGINKTWLELTQFASEKFGKLPEYSSSATPASPAQNSVASTPSTIPETPSASKEKKVTEGYRSAEQMANEGAPYSFE